MNSRTGWKRIFGKPAPENLCETKRPLRASGDEQELHQLAFEHAPVGIAFVGPDGRFLEVNPALCRLLGYTEEELQSLTFVDLTHPEDVAQGVELTHRMVSGDITGFKLEKRYLTKSGETVWGEVSVTLVRDSDGAALYGLVMIVDISERKRGEEALGETEKRFRILADTAPVMVWMSGPDKSFDFFNRGWLEFTGRTPEQESGQGWFEGVHPDDVACCRQTYLAAFQAREDFEMEHRLRRFDGEHRWVLDTGVPLFTPSGRFAGYIGSCLDITERQQAEEALRASEERFFRTFNLCPDPMAISTLADGRYLNVNESALAATGYTREEMIGRAPSEIGLWANLEERDKMLRALSEQGRIRNMEIQVRTKSGELHDVILAAEVIGVDGEQCLLTTTHDITARKRTGEALRSALEFRERVMEAATNAIAVLDSEGKFILANRRAAEITGYTVEDLIGRSFHTLLPETELARVSEQVQATLTRRVPVSQFECELLRQDGATRTISFSLEPLVLEGGQRGLVGTAEDITERRRAEAVLEESEDRCRDLIENSGVIIGTHDLEGNILSVNQSFVRAAGYEQAEELLGIPISDLLAPRVRHLFPGYLEKVRRTGRSHGLMTIVTPDGEEKILEYDNSVRQEGLTAPTVRCFARDVTERKRVEAALRESEARLRTLGDNLPSGVIFQIVQEPDGRIHLTHISASIEQMAGVSASEAMQDFSLLTDLILEEDRQRLQAAWKESLQALSVFDLECRFSTRQGEVKWARFRGAPRRLLNGGTLWDGIQVDVTDTRRDLESLLQTVGAIVWEGEEDLAARTFRFTFVSQQAAALLGYPVKDWLEQPTFWSDHLHPEDRQRVLALRTQAIAAKRDFDLEYRMMANDGRTVWLRGIVKVIAENDHHLKLRGITVDITEQQQAEAALRESEELFRTLAETTSAAIYIVRGNRCVYANPTAEARSGYTRDELLAMDVWDLVHPEVRERAREHLGTLHKEGLIPLHYEAKGLTKSGQARWVEVSATPITFQGQPSLLVTTFDITERKRTEAALRESEDRLKLALGAAHMGTWDWQLPTNELKWSDEMRQIFGLADGTPDVTTELFVDLIHPDDRQFVSRAHTRAINQGIPYDIEFRTVHRDGSVHWVMGKGKALLDDAGRMVRMLGVNMDITEHKHAEDALRRSEARYRAIVEDQTELICRLLPDGTLTFVNEPYACYFGRTPEELVGTSFRPFIPAEEEEHINQFLASFSPSNPVVAIEHRVVLPGGEVRWQQWTDRAIYDEQGRLLEFQCVGRDVTRQKEMEQALRQSQRRYELATAAGRVGLWDWNLETNDIYVDPELKALLGYRDDEIRNHMDDWGGRIHPEDREAVMAAAQSHLEGRAPSFEIEHRMVCKDGAICWFISRGTLVKGEDGARRIIGAKTDITERKQAEEARASAEMEREQTEESLHKSHKQIRDLAGRLIFAQEEERKYIARELHDDLNQQVAALAIGISRLKRQLPDADQAVHEQIAWLGEKTDWLSERIRRLSHEFHSSILQHVGLAAALKSYCSEFAEQEGIAVTLDLQDPLEAIPADEALCLYRVVQESLRNIARHSGAPSAEVKLANEGGTLELRVADRGSGFDPKQHPAHHGLGLVSIEERVRLLHGNFQLKTRPGAGTELIVQIPLRSEP